MTREEWKSQWKRLDQFRVGGEADRAQVGAEWFAQLAHYHVDAVDHGITQLIGSAKDTFLPGLGLLKDFIQQRIGRYDKFNGKCESCHGSGWVDAPIFRSNGLIYSNAVQRCTSCGIPAPKVEDRGRREPVNDLQTAEYLAMRFGRDQMPVGCEAKPSKPGQAAPLAEAMERLRIKLFGRDHAKGDAA
jgi:hypothetical protein